MRCYAYPFDSMERRIYDTGVNSLTAYALGRELNESLSGATIVKVSRYPLGITVETSHPAIPFLHVLHHGRAAELVPAARRILEDPHTNVAASVMDRSTIRGVEPLGMDRILLLIITDDAGWGGGGEMTVRIDMTPGSLPVTVFRGEGATLSEWHGPARARRPAGPAGLPSRKPFSILALPDGPPEEIAQAAADGALPEGARDHTRRWSGVRRTAVSLVERIGGIDPVLATVLSGESGGRIDAIWPRLVEIGEAASAGNFTWRRYDFPEAGEAGRCAIYPIALPVYAEPVVLENALAAVARRMEEVVLPAYVRSLRRTALSAARRELRKSERLAGKLAGELEEAKRSREYRHFGNLLAANRHLMKRGMREITVRRFSGEDTVTIPLSQRMGPDENIRRYFTRAKKGEKGMLIISGRKREVERDIHDRRAFITRLSKIASPDELVTHIPRHAHGAGQQRKETSRTRFKHFVIDERHTVYVGRKGSENDLLTHRFASPGDLWFHAQGITGSHVILRGASESTPKRILEKAAAIAAYFSKARHSSTVPVIYTEKRYVRKPRKSPPGTAVCQRGKTLYVRPSLPDGT